MRTSKPADFIARLPELLQRVFPKPFLDLMMPSLYTCFEHGIHARYRMGVAMGRRASVRYWQSRGGYCCWLNGRQHVLAEGEDDYPDGPTYQAAVRKFSELVSLSGAASARDNNPIRVVCEVFLHRMQPRLSEQSFSKYTRFLRKFVDETDPKGTTPVWQLTPQVVYDWFDRMRQVRVKPNGRRCKWGETTVGIVAKMLRTVFKWACLEGLIGTNPLLRLQAGRARSRGRESLTGRTPAERTANHRRILAAAPKAFRPFIVCLEATGARPGELANATAADFDAGLGAIIYHADHTRREGEFRHKTAGRDKDRIIFLSGESLDIVRELAAEHPTGYLFRPSRKPNRGRGRGKWVHHTICAYFKIIRDKVGLPRLTAYSYRHTFATAWLEQGKSVDVLAGLLGNTPAVIRKHYSHLLGDTSNLRAQLEAFRGVTPSAGGTGTPPPQQTGDGASAAG
jgi:integrase